MCFVLPALANLKLDKSSPLAIQSFSIQFTAGIGPLLAETLRRARKLNNLNPTDDREVHVTVYTQSLHTVVIRGRYTRRHTRGRYTRESHAVVTHGRHTQSLHAVVTYGEGGSRGDGDERQQLRLAHCQRLRTRGRTRARLRLRLLLRLHAPNRAEGIATETARVSA